MVEQVEVVHSAESRWEARSSGRPAGHVLAMRRPDRRTFVFFRDMAPVAYGPLVEALDRDLDDVLHTSVDLADEEALSSLGEVGFAAVRQESDYVLAVTAMVDATDAAALPEGYVLQNVLEVPEDDLRRLDDRLRDDVPGTDGWEWDAQGFREETYASEDFDPELYWVAADASTGERVALVRVWNRRDAPRLGLIAVLPHHRRRGIARALLGQVFRALGSRGVASVVTEIDDLNEPSRALLLGRGARRVGGSVEMVRRGPA